MACIGVAAVFVACDSIADRGASEAGPFEFVEMNADGKQPVGYDPCRAIHYVINPERAPDGGIETVHDAISKVAEATDMRFVYDGTTDEPLREFRPIYQPARYGRAVWAPILIGWVPQKDMVSKFRHALGAGGSAYETTNNGDRVYVSGIVTLNADASLEPGFGEGETWGDVVLHELGHVVGLGHVDDSDQVMFPRVTEGPARLGSGDQAGLERLGRQRGCGPKAPPGANFAAFYQVFVGDRLSLDVYRIGLDNDCVLNAFKYLGIGRWHGAYRSDCKSWDDPRLHLFYVSLGNNSKRSIGFRLRNLYVMSRDGTIHVPLDIRRFANQPRNFVPLAGIIEPLGFQRGFIAFHAPRDFVPNYLSYVDGEDLLTVRFDGRPKAFPPGSDAEFLVD